MSVGARHTLRIALGVALQFLLAVFWLVVGFEKLDRLWNPSTVHPADMGTWSEQFPVLLLVIVAVHEVVAGYLILAGRRVAGLALVLGYWRVSHSRCSPGPLPWANHAAARRFDLVLSVSMLTPLPRISCSQAFTC